MNNDNQNMTQVVRDSLEKACKAFSERIAPLGFARTKKMFWARRREHTVDFIHFHRHGSTYGGPRSASIDIRVHFGIRILNDGFPAPALNGPCSDPERLRAGRYQLRFNAQTGSTYDRCIDDLERFAKEQGETWFRRFADVKTLLEDAQSPMSVDAKESLRLALSGKPDASRVAASLKLLGVKA